MADGPELPPPVAGGGRRGAAPAPGLPGGIHIHTWWAPCCCNWVRCRLPLLSPGLHLLTPLPRCARCRSLHCAPAAGRPASFRLWHGRAARSAPPRSTAAQVQCLLAAGFEWQPFGAGTRGSRVMAVPAAVGNASGGCGAGPCGFQRRCDWVIGSRQSLRMVVPWATAWGDIRTQPRTVFVRTDLVMRFAARVLPCISTRFVLLVGGQRGVQGAVPSRAGAGTGAVCYAWPGCAPAWLQQL